MTPIDKLSDIRKMPRLGKVRLGIKVEPEEKNAYPRATDYFVVPEEIKQFVGERPTKLSIMFPTENQEEFAQQYLKCYSYSQGLICLSEDSQILTNRGWAGIDDLRIGDIVVTMDIVTGLYREEAVEDKQILPGPPYLLNFHTRSLDALISQDHRVIYRDSGKYQAWKIREAKDLPAQILWPAVGPLDKRDMQVPDDIIRLLGWVVTEGTNNKPSFARSHHGPPGGKNRLTPEEREARQSYLSVSQSKPGYVQEIKSLLHRLFGKAHEHTVENTGGPGNRNADVLPRTVSFLGKEGTDLLHPYLGGDIHRIPRAILSDASPRQLKILFETMMKANGSRDERHGMRYYAGKNKGQADDFQELASRLGLRSSINPGSRHPNTAGQFWLQISPEWKTVHSISQRPELIPYSGRVWCITVPNGTFLARRKGRVFTTGNCKGDGLMCWRKVDTLTGDFATHLTDKWVKTDGLPCEPSECPMYATEKPQCRRVMNLLFFMPDVPGLGVWQLDTSSFYSIVNVNSCLDLIKRLCGRISMIPLTLSLEPQIVEPPGIKKKTVHILQIRSDVKLAEIQRLGRKKPAEVLLPTLDEEEAPDDLYPSGVLKEAEEAKAQPLAKPILPQVPPQLVKTAADINAQDCADNKALYQLSEYFWGMDPDKVAKFLGYINQHDYEEARAIPYESFCVIRDALATPDEEGGGEGPPQDIEPDVEPEGGEEGSEQAGGRGGAGGAAQRTSTVPKGEKKEKSRGGPAAEGSEEGLAIDPAWLARALQLIKWSEVTAKTWLAKEFKIDTKGSLITDVLPRLTKEQAAAFLKEVRGRATQQQQMDLGG